MSRRDQLLTIAGLVIVLLAGFYFTVYQPKTAEYGRLTAELTAREARLAEVEAIAKQAPDLERRYQEKQALIATLEAKLPTAKEIPALLVQLERLAGAVAVSLEAVRPGALEAVTAEQAGGQGTQPAYFRFPVALSFRGSFSEMVALTSALQDFPRLIAVTRITMNPQALPELGVELDTQTYVLPKEGR